MANFCQGILKIRGDKKDICNFIENNLTFYPDPSNLTNKMYFRKGFESLYEVGYELGYNVNYIHLNNSNKHYIKESEIVVHDSGDYWLACVTLIACWNIDIDYLVGISKQYNIDLKIFAFEKGKKFNRDIEIHKGRIIKDNTFKFKDYMWSCIDPTIGG